MRWLGETGAPICLWRLRHMKRWTSSFVMGLCHTSPMLKNKTKISSCEGWSVD
jgi:hypothetical protein